MSLKLGNVTINKIRLGTTLINKVYLGSSQIYPTAGGGATLLEGFEVFSGGLPNTLPWANSSGTIAQSSSNVTQGSFSCRVQGVTSGNNLDTETNGIDLTGKTTLRMDVFVQTIGASASVKLEAYSVVDVNSASDVTTAGGTGSFSLVVDLTSLSNKTDIEFFIYQTSAIDIFDYYIDNLRVE